MASRSQSQNGSAEGGPTEPVAATGPVAVPDPDPRPLPKRRAANPAVDDVIHSGEIVPRSMIVKSSDSMAKIEVRADPTEPTTHVPPALPPLPMSPRIAPRRRSLRVSWLVAAIVSGLGAGALVLADRKTSVPTTNPHAAEIQTTAEMLGTALDADARAAMMRAEAVATAPALRAAIETDPQTLADMARDKDIVLSVERGEQLEIIQVRDGKRTTMLHLPTASAPIKAPVVGATRLDQRGDGLVMIATAAVAQQRSGISGEVVFVVPVDLEPIKQRVATQAVQATVVGLRSPVVLAHDGDKTGTALTVPIKTKMPEPVLALSTVMATELAGSSKTIRLARDACAVMSIAFVLIFGLSFAIRRR